MPEVVKAYVEPPGSLQQELELGDRELVLEVFTREYEVGAGAYLTGAYLPSRIGPEGC